jgi:hypothetical protein
MNAQQSQLEHLPIEILRIIFEYLSPHDLLFAFNNLNHRLTSIVAQQSLCLPNNQYMSLDLYLHIPFDELAISRIRTSIRLTFC